jgi:hypothetical protein
MEDHSPTRAPRMPLHLPLRYRRVGEDVWFEAITQNISRSGVLFSAANGVADDARVELEFHLPFVNDLRAPGGRVTAHARIVRHAQFLGLDGTARPALAAAFLDYDFLPAA